MKQWNKRMQKRKKEKRRERDNDTNVRAENSNENQKLAQYIATEFLTTFNEADAKVPSLYNPEPIFFLLCFGKDSKQLGLDQKRLCTLYFEVPCIYIEHWNYS